MRKVLVLMLVVGFGSMATAGLTLTVNGYPAENSSISIAPSDYLMIGLYTDGSVEYMGYLSIAEGGPGSWTGDYNVYIPPAFEQAYAYYYGPITGMGDTWIVDFFHSHSPQSFSGIAFEFGFHGDGPGDVLISYMDDMGVLHDTLAIHVPEPMSIGLLGLGGLLLRRKR